MNIGDYVRTNDGYIYKIKKIPTEYKVIVDAKSLLGEELEVHNIEIIKSSPNIIDLIEEGDYVNGFYVINKPGKLFNRTIHTEFDDFCEEDIETIVTKEQFEAMKYEIK